MDRTRSSRNISIGTSSASRTLNVFTCEDTAQIVEQSTERKNITHKLNREILPPLTPAPFLRLPRPDHNSLTNFYDSLFDTNEELRKHLRDVNCELDCVRKTLNATYDILAKTKSNLSVSLAKEADLRAKVSGAEAACAKLRSEMNDLLAKLASSEADRKLQLTKIASLERMSLNQKSAQKDTPATSTKLLKCPHCDYVTKRSNRMKTHCEEGCKAVEAVKSFVCEICGKSFTRNQMRYHLNQYANKSSHAKNGHQKFSPKHHREMLNKIKKTI